MDILQFYLVMSRRVNANASPDVPKPLYQWGGYASPLIQSFGCTDSARALRRTGSARALRRTGSARALRRPPAQQDCYIILAQNGF
jgi:hypothetical protein